MVSTWFLDMEDEIKEANIVLASQSPNRLALLKNIGINPRVVVSGFEENLPKTLPPSNFVEETAYQKALAVADILDRKKEAYDVIIACDTVIAFDNEIIGKPKDVQDARSILTRLNNQWHSVFSGVTLIDSKRNIEKFHVQTQVKFGDIPPKMIETYIKSGECFNKAGAYGIQTKAAAFVESIHGCYFNIVGLPVYEVVKRIQKGFAADEKNVSCDAFGLPLYSHEILKYENRAKTSFACLSDSTLDDLFQGACEFGSSTPVKGNSPLPTFFDVPEMATAAVESAQFYNAQPPEERNQQLSHGYQVDSPSPAYSDVPETTTARLQRTQDPEERNQQLSHGYQADSPSPAYSDVPRTTATRLERVQPPEEQNHQLSHGYQVDSPSPADSDVPETTTARLQRTQLFGEQNRQFSREYQTTFHRATGRLGYADAKTRQPMVQEQHDKKNSYRHCKQDNW